ncbi:MAG: hypothetical protein DCC57_23170 [Chloroflexi bacterium]|nr:MAG: hypothetical protein DCC57_23170 [Chloroflexota bacterium]
MKLDKFTWAVIAVIALLIVAAVVSVTRSSGAAVEETAYLEDNSPEAPVHNAFVALQRGDRTRARAQYSQAILDELDGEKGWDPFSGTMGDRAARRLRIVSVQPDAEDADRALVSFVIDTYSRGGLFGAGSTWSREGTVEVVREEGVWKINAQEFFY